METYELIQFDTEQIIIAIMIGFTITLFTGLVSWALSLVIKVITDILRARGV